MSESVSVGALASSRCSALRKKVVQIMEPGKAYSFPVPCCRHPTRAALEKKPTNEH